jgi:hypothetical protein
MLPQMFLQMAAKLRACGLITRGGSTHYKMPRRNLPTATDDENRAGDEEIMIAPSRARSGPGQLSHEQL